MRIRPRSCPGWPTGACRAESVTPRARRLLAAALLVVLTLFTGRWLADFVTSRWWAASISPAAIAAITRWQLLGLALDAGAVAIASTWFAAQALLVARAIGTVQLQRRVGEEFVRQVVPMRWLVAGAVATGALLGLFTGAGARAWRAPLLLALNQPYYGLTDPLLGVDLGVLVARYPLWRAVHGFAVVLVVLGIVLTLALYTAIGAMKRHEGRTELHPDARRHLGGLFALLGVVLAAGYLLAPYRLATSIDVPLAGAAASTRILAAHAAAGAAIAASVLSIAWIIKARMSLLLSGWMVLALAAITERLVVPAFVAEAGSTAERAGWVRQMDSVFHRINLIEGTASTDSMPPVVALWEESAALAWAASRGDAVVSMSPGGTGADAGWLLVTTPDTASTRLLVTTILASRTDPAGRPIVIDSGYPAVLDARSVPGATGWAVASGGVRVGRWLRPLAIAWAQQAPGVWKVPASATVDWARDPRDRAGALVPALAWRELGAAYVDGRLAWVLSGLATVSRAPLATRVSMDGGTYSGLVPSLIAIVVAETGEISFFPDPSADALGLAWARAFRGIVADSTDLPESVRTQLAYPREWFERQLEVLTAPHWGMGVVSRTVDGSVAERPATVWAPAPGALQQAMDDPERRQTLHVLTARRVDGIAEVVLDRLAIGTLPSGRQLSEAWAQMPQVEQLRDSVRAAGDSLVAGPVRWHRGATGVVAWQAFTNTGRDGPLTLLWLGTASTDRLGGARRSALAWSSVIGPVADSGETGAIDEVGRVEAVRSWVRRADSALVRGDLTAFARAWEALRGLLLDTLP